MPYCAEMHAGRLDFQVGVGCGLSCLEVRVGGWDGGVWGVVGWWG